MAEQADISLRKIADPDSRLPLKCFADLLQAAKQVLDQPALALHHGAEIGMSDVSIVGLIMESSSTMGEAFRQMQRYGRIVTEIAGLNDAQRFELALNNNKLFLIDHVQESVTFPELTELAFMRLACGPRKFLSKPHIQAIHFSHSAPAHKGEYAELFKCPVYFDAKFNAMEVDPQVVSWEIPSGPQYIHSVLTKHADQLLANLDASNTVRRDTETVLMSVLHQGEVSANDIATTLGYSRQTLFRKLKLEGTSFTQVLTQLREQLAKQYLQEATLSINEIAYLLGFSEAAAFSRAFKRWLQQSPQEYRQCR